MCGFYRKEKYCKNSRITPNTNFIFFYLTAASPLAYEEYEPARVLDLLSKSRAIHYV